MTTDVLASHIYLQSSAVDLHSLSPRKTPSIGLLGGAAQPLASIASLLLRPSSPSGYGRLKVRMLRSGLRGYEAEAASAWAKSAALKFMLSVSAEGVFVRVRWRRVVDAVD